jgi:hypothetical protein
MCPILSSKGHRQSGGHWNAAFRLLGTNIGLAGFFGGWWCVGGRGALSGSGVRGVNGSLVVMSKYSPKKKIWRSRGAAPSEEQTTVGRVVPPRSCSLETIYNREYRASGQNCTPLEINGQCFPIWVLDPRPSSKPYNFEHLGHRAECTIADTMIVSTFEIRLSGPRAGFFTISKP